MSAFRYQGGPGSGGEAAGIIEAEDRRAALRLLAARGIFPAALEANGQVATAGAVPAVPAVAPGSEIRFGTGIRRKEITAFSRELAALLGAAIPIPQALEGIADAEANPALKAVLTGLAGEVRTGSSLSAALARHPKLFSGLYTSMVRVGEEAGALPRVMDDLADLLESTDEIRGEVVAAIAYPLFVLGFGFVTVIVLLTVVLPKLFAMLDEMLDVLPLPTLVLLRVSGFFSQHWPWLLLGAAGLGALSRWQVRTPAGALWWDGVKLRVPVLGPLVRTAALSRFARTLGILLKSGVSLLPALRIVEATVGNLVLAAQLARVGEETRGGDPLATPLRKLGIFPQSAVQMIAAGEESGKLDEMLGKVAQIEERHLRAQTKTLVSLLAPVLILLVGGVVGFMVLAILLPIFRLSRGIH